MTDVVEQPARAVEAAPRRKLSRGAVVIGLLGIVWLLVGLAGGQYQGKLSSVQKNDNAAYLPSSAESTKVDTESQLYQSVQAIPGFLVYQRPGGLTAADRAAISAQARAFRSTPGVAADQVGSPQYAADGATASLAVPLVGKRGNVSVQGDTLVKVEKAVIKQARAGVPAGLVVHSAGPGGLLVAFIDAFSGIDGTLLIAAGVVVILVLLVVYRSPFLWFFPLFSAVLALGTAALVIYFLAKHGVLTLNGQSQGILSVLVLGAGTDYALLLTSRYREELHNYESRVQAMTKAWRRASTAILASGSTVILGLLCLTIGELNSDRSLGPVCAIGIACTVGVMLTFLPLALTVMPRGVFWPRVPRPDHAGDLAKQGPWSRFAASLGRNDRRAWIGTAVVLLIAAGAMSTLRTGGLSTSQSFTNHPDAVVGQKIYDAHFARGSGAPAQITARVAYIPQVIAAVSRVPGVSTAPGSVCVQPDYARLAARASGATGPAALGGGGCAPPDMSVAPHDGRLLVDATLQYNYDSPQAYRTVQRIRAAVHAIPGAEARVGGAAAINYDTNQASRHDRNLIIPIVLLVILLVLVVLLRAILAPLLLIASVVLSFTASLGVSALFFNHVFHFANADPGFPLFVFVFLVALGVDYNIFLMTRVREETQTYGTREGILRGLAVTGGVITSAGVVLAATFAVLGVLPLVFLSEVGFTVALGVLVDTVVVRSILVPALGHDIGQPIWWPSRLGTTPDSTTGAAG
ncbi:MAG TPA: MMPL family transporter [Acidimicrobiales bacterium]|nr:MMPL family transporter [Acidimicrobiales bacterium]